MSRQFLPIASLIALTFTSFACNKRPAEPGDGANTASISISDLKTKSGPEWENLKLELSRDDETKIPKQYPRSAFKDSKLNDVTVKVEFGTYRFLLEYFDKSEKLVYESCPADKTKDHVIQTPLYEAKIKVCKADSNDVVDVIEVKPSADVQITPQFRGDQSGEDTGAPASPAGSCKADGQDQANSDEVYGKCVDRKQSWYVAGGEIYRRGSAFPLRGVNWFGLDGSDSKLHGLSPWVYGLTIETVVKGIKKKGFNALRIPLAPEVINGLNIAELKSLLAVAEAEKVAVLLDIHTCSKSAGHLTGKPDACSSYGKSGWLESLAKLAELSKSYSYVVGIDLYNEPFELSWDEWRALANDGAKTVLQKNPNILVFVEGVGNKSPSGKEAAFYGENLFEADTKKLSIPASRLVLSPHAYGPSVHEPHTYFAAADFPRNMPAIWDEHFGRLKAKGYAIAIGEFGGKYNKWERETGYNRDMKWQDAFVKYLVDRKIKNFFYWSLNPNSGDTKGLLTDQWATGQGDQMELVWEEAKLDLLAPILK